jgi:hypothetical protein
MTNNREGSHAGELEQRWGIHACGMHMRKEGRLWGGSQKKARERSAGKGMRWPRSSCRTTEDSKGSGGLQPEARVVLHVLTAPPDT